MPDDLIEPRHPSGREGDRRKKRPFGSDKPASVNGASFIYVNAECREEGLEAAWTCLSSYSGLGRARLRHPRLLGASSFLLVPAGIGLFVVRGWAATLCLWESRRRQRRPGRRKTEVLQDPTCHARAGDVRDELHPAAAHREGKHIDGEDLLEQLSSSDAVCMPGRDGALGAD